MGLRCKLFGHRAVPPEVLNEGLYFATCGICSADIIRQRGGRWYSVPPGFRVAWRHDGKHSLSPWKAVNLAHDKRHR
jgi:hypothetical protein